MGVIINRISPYQLAEICQSAQIGPVDSLKGEHSVHHGGPVSAAQSRALSCTVIIFAADDTTKYQRALTLLGVDLAARSGHGGQA